MPHLQNMPIKAARPCVGRFCQGFTILEFLLVVTLMALAGTIVSFQVYHRMDETTLWSATHRLGQVARHGRLLAGQHHLPCRLHVNPTDGSFWLTVQPPSRPVARAGLEERPSTEVAFTNPYAQPSYLPERLRFGLIRTDGVSPLADGEWVVNFDVDGTAQAALIQIVSAEKTQTLVIHPWTSRAQWRDGAVTKLPVDRVAVDPMASDRLWR